MSQKILNPRAIGDKIINYSHIVVGGGNEESTTKVLLEDGSEATQPVYRGDSSICQAAIHAGVVSNTRGGCGIVKKIGSATSFPSSTRNGISSIEFPSYFPLSFSFSENVECDATDLRWPLLAINVGFSVIFSLFVTSPALFFTTIATATFLHVGLVSESPPSYSTAGLISDLASKALPTAFGAYVLYLFAVRRTLKGLTAQVEKTVLWLGAAWVGALTNYTLDFIPIQRLTGHDLKQQPGAIVALIVIIVVLFFIIIGQIYYLRLEGRLRRYLALYSIFALVIIIFVNLPELNLRIHHYIIALLLMPGTAIQTRPSLLYQGILTGLYVNGLARWGWDSVLQTDIALRGDAGLNFGVPVIPPPVINLGDNQSITFDLPLEGGTSDIGLEADGISVLVNDVERYRGYIDDLILSGSPLTPSKNSTAAPKPDAGEGATQAISHLGKKRQASPKEPKLDFTHHRRQGLAEPEYFRFAFMSGIDTWDYTKAGVWMPDGSWVQMGEGISG